MGTYPELAECVGVGVWHIDLDCGIAMGGEGASAIGLGAAVVIGERGTVPGGSRYGLGVLNAVGEMPRARF